MSNLSQQAIDLRQQMEQIRCDLAENVSELTEDARTLVDYRYYLQRHPWACFGAAAAVGFMLIPRRAPQVVPDQKMLAEMIKNNQIVVQTKSEINQKRGLLATGASLLAAAALKAAVGFAQQKATARLTGFLHPGFQPTSDEHEFRPARPR